MLNDDCEGVLLVPHNLVVLRVGLPEVVGEYQLGEK